MALLEVPTRNDLPAYKMTIPLDGISYELDFTFNDRMSKWFLSVSDSLGNMIQGPVPVVSTWPLFNRFKEEAVPPGTLFCFDSSGENLDPGRFDLGARCRIFYLEFGS